MRSQYVHTIDWEGTYGGNGYAEVDELINSFEVHYSVHPDDPFVGCGPSIEDVEIVDASGRQWAWGSFVEEHEHRTGQDEDALRQELLDNARDEDRARGAWDDEQEERWEVENVY